MDVAVGLPNAVPGTDGALIRRWAGEAEAMGAAGVAVLDRLCFDSHDPLVVLAHVAAFTTSVDLCVTVLVAPLREQATLRDQIAALDRLSAGRLVLGAGAGGRTDDYEQSEFSYRTRGARLDRLLHDLRGDPQTAGVPLLVGGHSAAAYDRAARAADGYVHAGGTVVQFGRAADRVREAWKARGRAGQPRLWGTASFGLGAGAPRGRDYLRDYYRFTGDRAERVAQGMLADAAELADTVTAYSEAGCDRLALTPAVADPEQLPLLARALEDVDDT